MRYLYLLYLFFCVLLASAQDKNTIKLDEKFVPLSPTATQMNKFSDIPINYSTGVVDISIPLLDVAGKTIQVPIGLRYSGGGVKVNDPSNKVGLGWYLDVGGAINRTIRSLPDEGINVRLDVQAIYHRINEAPRIYDYPYNVSDVVPGFTYIGDRKDATREELLALQITGGYYFDKQPLLLNIPNNTSDLINFVNNKNATPEANDFLDLIDYGYRDLEPDIFNISVPGYAAKFSTGVDGKFSFISGNEIKSNIQTSVVDTLVLNSYYRERWVSGSVEYVGPFIDSTMMRRFQPWDLKLENGMRYSFSEFGKETMDLREMSSPVTTWNLSKIVDENNQDTVSFSYSRQNNRHPLDGAGASRRPAPIDSNDRMFFIDKRSNPENKATFCDLIQTKYEKVKFFYSNQLDSIVVFDHDENRKKKVRFYYSKFKLSQRLKLDSISFVSHDSKLVTQSYRFSYYDQDVINGQSVQYEKRKQDYWGYFNNREDSATKVNASNPDSKPQWPYSMIESLTAVDNSQGNRQDFEYEPNTYSYITEKDGYNFYNSLYNPLDANIVGGIRIKKIKIFDKKRNAFLWEKELTYNEQGSNASSGVLNMFPAQYGPLSSVECQGYSSKNIFWMSRVNQFNSVKELPIVTYKNVRETIKKDGINNGYNEYIFFTDYETENKYYTHYDSLFNPQNKMSNFPPDRYLALDYLNPLNGKLKNKKIFDRRDTLIAEEIYKYDVKKVGGLENRVKMFKLISENVNLMCDFYTPPPPGGIPPELRRDYVSIYYLFPKHTYLKEKISNSYFGTDKVSNSEKYYYESTNHNQITRTVNTSSAGDSTVSRTIFGLDLPDNIIGYTYFNKFKQVGYNPTVLKYTAKGTKVIAAELSNYVSINNNLNYPIQVKTFQTLNTLKTNLFQLTAGQFTNYNASIWETRKDFNYDSKIRLIEQRVNDGGYVSYIWNDKLRGPLAKVENTNQANIAFASFEYPKDFGFTVPSAARNAFGYLSGRSYKLSSGNIVKSGLVAAENYYLSYWINGTSALTVGGSTETTLIESKNGWNKYRHLIKNTTSLVVSGTQNIDELLLIPQKSTFQLFEFDRFDNLTKLVANQSAIFSFDNLQRLKEVSDGDQNILTATDYHIGTYPYDNRYFSAVITDSVRRNNCAVGQVGSFVSMTTYPGQFVSQLSQSDADSKARNYLNQNLQTYANQNGSCLVEYKSKEIAQTIRKTACTTGLLGTSVTFTVPKDSYRSTISQADADQKAQQYFDANFEDYVNSVGECVASSNLTTVTITNLSGVSMEDLSLKFITAGGVTMVNQPIINNSITLYLKKGGYGLVLTKAGGDSAYYLKLNSSTDKLISTGVAEPISLSMSTFNVTIVGEEIL